MPKPNNQITFNLQPPNLQPSSTFNLQPSSTLFNLRAKPIQ
ncbi:hypothetical protein [Moorena sp. SIOASIH]|nr:hypothetical protein [Moorena sp. SIOASIH]